MTDELQPARPVALKRADISTDILQDDCPEHCDPALRVHVLPGPGGLRVCRACWLPSTGR